MGGMKEKLEEATAQLGRSKAKHGKRDDELGELSAFYTPGFPYSPKLYVPAHMSQAALPFRDMAELLIAEGVPAYQCCPTLLMMLMLISTLAASRAADHFSYMTALLKATHRAAAG